MKKKERTYFDKVHTWGRISSISALCVLFTVPLAISLYYEDAWPDLALVAKALSTIIPIYWTTAVVEVISYTPLLGGAGTYLSFVTGNITNLKMPCALNAMENAKVKANTDEGEVISTIAIGVSAIVTTIIIALGVLIFAPFLSNLTSAESAFAPAFKEVIPALFGALGASYFKKHWKISIFPILIGVVTLVFAPTLAVGTLIFITIVAAIGGSFAMYKLKWI